MNMRRGNSGVVHLLAQYKAQEFDRQTVSYPNSGYYIYGWVKEVDLAARY